jgi:membrane-bound lytic murein transglycosylase MltF
VSAEGGAAPARIEDLAGRRVHVAAGTHLERELRALSDRLEAQGLEPVQIAAPARLAVEDLLELVGAGVIELTVADAHVARVYARVHAGLVLHPDLVVHRGSSLGWAVRSDDPELRASLDAFLVAHSEGTLLGNLLFRRYYGRTTYARRSLLEPGHTMLDRYREVFERYAARYGFDWLAIAAQAYQESRLDPAARSRKGAVGLMQLLPSTAADPNVGIPDISTNDANVHAGVRYLAFLRDRYFSSNAIAPDARFDFALAAYNLGPNRVRELRDLASEQGLDANRWFGQVERVAASEVGREPVRYVAGVKKTWTAYRSFVEERALRARGRYELRRREAERERVGYSADTLRASVAAAPM